MSIAALAEFGKANGLPFKSYRLLTMTALGLGLAAASFTLWRQTQDRYSLILTVLSIVFLIIASTVDVRIDQLFIFFLIIFSISAGLIGSKSFFVLAAGIILLYIFSSQHNNSMAYISMLVAVLGWLNGEFFKHK